MTPEAPNETAGGEDPGEFKQRVAQARHDLRNPLAHILGFSEMLIEKAGADPSDSLKPQFESIYQLADALVAAVNHSLELERARAGQHEARALKQRLLDGAASITAAAEELARHARTRSPDPFSVDLHIIAGAGRRLSEVTATVLEFLVAKESP